MNKIIVDIENFHTLALDLMQYRRHMHPFIGDFKARNIDAYDIPVAEFWEPIDFVLKAYDGCEMPDISQWSPLNLVINEKALKALEPYLTANGEILPLHSADTPENYYFFNCLKTLQPEKGDAETDIFKSRQGEFPGMFCSDDFREAVEKAGLKGIRFTENLVSLA